jgi:hypothetical protein
MLSLFVTDEFSFCYARLSYRHVYAYSVGGYNLQCDSSSHSVNLQEFSMESSVERPSNGLVLPAYVNVVSMQAVSVDDHLSGGVTSLFLQHVKPRVYNPNIAKLWTPMDSLFARVPHITQGERCLNTCFETDWAMSKLSAMKDVVMCSKLHDSLRSKYDLIKVYFLYVHLTYPWTWLKS